MLWRHVYALETCVCCGDMGYAVWTWDMSSCGRRICLLVGEEYMVSSCWRRIYGYGRCLLVGEEYMGMLLKTFQGALRLAAGAFFLKKTFYEKISFLKKDVCLNIENMCFFSF